MNFRTPAVRLGLLPAGIALALTPAFASAQEASGTTDLDRIQVTGSRIRQASTETAQPVIALQRADIEKQGFTSVADIVQNLSATGSPAISRADALSSGEEVGGQYVDLRNLGPERTLVLLDGKRMGVSSGGYTDLASIPTSVVERIEVLTDGASAIYGSDAIAGVVNIITRKNFDGLEASVYKGQYGQGDGDKTTYNFVYGQTGDRGSITLGAEYSEEEPVLAKNRRYSASANGYRHPVPTDDDTNGWSAITEKGVLVTDDGNYVLNPGGASNNFGDYHELGNADLSNPSQQMYLSTGIKRRSVFSNGQFDFTDNIRGTASVLYTEREALQQIAGYPYRSAAYDTQMDANSVFNPLDTDVDFMRRTWEVPRQTKSELNTFRFSGGLEGSFEFADKYFDWDVGYVYNRNKGVKTGTGNLFIPNVKNAVGPSYLDANGIAQCGTAAAPIAGCTPWNPLLPYGSTADGSLSNPDLQKYLFLPTHDTSLTTSKVYSANLSGAIVTLPAGDLSFATGYEHREEDAEYNPDALLQSGLSTDLAGAPTAGGYKLDEFYLELNVPILADLPFAKELSVDMAGRYSDYNTFGDTVNSKFGLKWKPIDDLLVRGTYATGFRAPTVANLYGGTSQSFDKYTDPCDTFFGAAVRNPDVAARCGGAVPANFRQEASGGIDATGPGAQSNYPYLSGSNDGLLPETSKTWTVGLVYSPNFVQGLDVSLDWWKIRIDNVIAAESVTSILNQCYVLNNANACDRVTRDTDSGQVVDVTRTLINGGYQETAGYDLGIRYRLPELSFGNIVIDWKTTYVDYLEYKRDNEAETAVEQHTGWGTGDWGGNFRVRSNLNIDWSLGNFGVNWGMRYYSGLKEECAYDREGGPECNNPSYSSAYTLAIPVRNTGSNTFHDLQVRYNTPWDATISAGANNVFNHEGPVMYSQPNSSFSYYGGFDIGRFYYLKYTQRF
ncbi:MULTISPECIES: TonB-dependent receptor plug domain-containing protein [Stenotrophomonas]|jgi:iron complex outermembrane receptor protein|uniref:TonB-dependent receptor plug domain-containing protein n=1 Tax=Stenotrophomonas TaxID=40323 RepID=UPI0024DE6A3C|nr:TonB-dependent receptor [Stenotrophomonas sp. BIO128-Bstrain]WIA61781.1 TonB-dependent receptor [Stenotrophomonas sp. BIO128-Bstrain]